MANLTWLSWVLYADAIASPAGSALAFTAAAGRESFAMAKNGFLPRAAAKVDRRSGIPRRALVINFVIGLAFLLPLHSWQSIVAATSELALIAYALPSVSSIAFRRVEGAAASAIAFLAPAAFVLASMILYWATWKELRIALPVLLVGAIVYGVQQVRGGVDWLDVRVGLWLVAYLVAILVMSAFGSQDFGGTNWIPAPWDSVVVAAIGAVGYEWGVRNAVKYLRVHPAPDPKTPAADDSFSDFGSVEARRAKRA